VTGGVACALSDGQAFKHASLWVPSAEGELHHADITGDGRADLCLVDAGVVRCGIAP
jgi:hypothetical protein